ncbi:MAG: hypothetical protein GY794_25700 [bacterium]|nr:hypothetical protein [bacterium]
MASKTELPVIHLILIKIIALGSLLGPTVFFFIALSLMGQVGNEYVTDQDRQMVFRMTSIAMVTMIVSNLAALYAPKLAVKISTRKSGPGASLGQAVFTGLILRYAFSSGPSTVGMTSIIMGAISGYMPWYIWVNILPLAIVYAVIITGFPTTGMIEKQASKLSVQN